MIVRSHIGQMTTEDFRRVLRNALIFLAPLAIVVIPQLQAGKSLQELQGFVYLWLLNTALDFFRKLLEEVEYEK